MPSIRQLAAPRTAALRRALLDRRPGPGAADDLLFLEAWELRPTGDMADVLRVRQLRRANPDLAAAIKEELTREGRTAPTGDPRSSPRRGTCGGSMPWPVGRERAWPPRPGRPHARLLSAPPARAAAWASRCPATAEAGR
jgi:hypothetical protein